MIDAAAESRRRTEDLVTAVGRQPLPIAQCPRHRLRADRHRPGGGVRLRRHPGLPRPARRRHPHDPRQLQPGHDHDRRGRRRRRLHRAAHADVIRRVIQRERPDGLLPTLGGQTGLNLAVQVAELGILDRYGVRLLGTPLSAIKQAEDRALFKELLDEIGEPAVDSAIVTSIEEAREFAKQVPLPLVIRPAFTLGGTGGGVAHTPEELDRIVASGTQRQPDPPDPARAVADSAGKRSSTR